MKSTVLKLKILSEGVNYDSEFLHEYNRKGSFIPKRRAYGTGDSSLDFAEKNTPQEIFLNDRTIIACNYNKNSKYRIFFDFDKNEFFISIDGHLQEITFPDKPDIYGILLKDGSRVEEYATVYGNSTLGFFSPGHCYYFNSDRECKFCSLGEARNSVSDHKTSIRPEKAMEVMDLLELHNIARIKRILVNGGTTRNYDVGFEMHKELLLKLKPHCLRNNINSHLISLPPMNLEKINGIKNYVNSWAISIEIFNPKKFSEICPGKSEDYGRDKLLDAYSAAVLELGKGNVYAGFVAGLEPLDDLIQGINFFAEMGVVPAVAVFHPDHGSKYANYPRPSFDYIYSVCLEMSHLYKKYGFKPFIEGSGRNSLDTEAFKGELINE
ncbi:radical SAM protein [Musicola paradisiaca]|uniref:Biotin synthase n=1 Tax=Musicola paradisiaca (strain Ech703) TaxID=579405 RepID=C6CBI5_MUSP7|nr:radical SAM protein [Musicola paradisiaca]ACS84770.1 conserved hypothetical protein [Musicola paradisiaca Ech703]